MFYSNRTNGHYYSTATFLYVHCKLLTLYYSIYNVYVRIVTLNISVIITYFYVCEKKIGG